MKFSKKQKKFIREKFDERLNQLTSVAGMFALDKVGNTNKKEIKFLDDEIENIFWEHTFLVELRDKIISKSK